VNYFNCAV